MKDEEMAEQFADNISGLELTCSLLSAKDKSHAYRLGRYDGFLEGLKAGRPQWHYLTENPNDLPIGEVFYWFDENPNLKDGKVYGRSIGYYNPYEKEWHGYYKGCPCRVHNVIAWCEIPTFDKE